MFTLQGDIYNGQTASNSLSAPSLRPRRLSRTMSRRFRRQYPRSLATRISRGSDLQIQAYFDRTYRQALQYGETRGTFDADYVQHQRIRAPRTSLWGLGARVSPSHFMQTVPGRALPADHLTDSIYSGFVQDEMQIVPRQAHAHRRHQGGAR